MCTKYADLASKQLSNTTVENLRNNFGGSIMANHALLMRRHMPRIPQPVSKNPIWRYGNRPTWFTGTVYTDGSTTICHSYPEARRSGYAAVVIGEQLHNSDSSLTVADDIHRPEPDHENGESARRPDFSEGQHRELEPNPVTINHSNKKWPFQLHRRDMRNDITRILDQTLHDKGVTVDWRVLTIQGEDVLRKCVK